MLGRTTLAFALIAAILASACDRRPAVESGAAPAPPPDVVAGPASGKVVARYGAEVLTADEFAAEMLRLPDRNRVGMNADARRAWVDNFILADLMFREGQRQGLDRDPEIVRQVEDLRRRLVVQRIGRSLQEMPAVTDDEVRRYYDAHPERFSETTIRARHILLKDETRAREVRAQVVAEPARFAEIAREASSDLASARQGGDLGWFGRGRMVGEFEEAAFALPVGQVSEPVKSPYGWHVILVDEVKRGAPEPFDEVKEQLRMMLRNQALQSRTNAFQDDLRKRAGVQIDAAIIEEVAAGLPTPDPAAGIHGSQRSTGH